MIKVETTKWYAVGKHDQKNAKIVVKDLNVL